MAKILTEDFGLVDELLTAYIGLLVKDAVRYVRDIASKKAVTLPDDATAPTAAQIAYQMIRQGADGSFEDVMTGVLAGRVGLSPRLVYAGLLDRVTTEATSKLRKRQSKIAA